MTPRLLLLPVACLLVSANAQAHLVSTRFGEFYAGMLHPVTSLLHLVPWIALALLAALQGKQGTRDSLITFPMTLVIGMAMGLAIPPSQWATMLALSSFLILGLCVALGRVLPRSLFLCLVITCGLIHGYANTLADLSTRATLLYMSGVALAGYILVALLGSSAIKVQAYPWGRIGIRALGSWILAIGMIYTGFTLTGASGV